jgi:carotenoid cleavage dioxygenase
MDMLAIQKKVAMGISRWAQKRAPATDSNMFLEGQYAPVAGETTCHELSVTGSIPQELDGVLARIGPNPVEPPNPATYHWFTGDGMVHGVRFREGRALWYRSRYVGTDKVNRVLGKPILPGYRNGIVDVVNTNIIGHGGRLWAMVEAGAVPVEMDEKLNSIRHGLFDAPQPGPFTAHPHLDPETGELHAICYDALKRDQVLYQVIDRNCQLTHCVRIPVKHGPMMHDCAITKSRVIVFDLPVTFSFKSILQGASMPYRWNPKHEARIGLLPRNGEARDMRWLHIDPCYVFHTGNARDLPNGGVMLELVVHERMFDGSIQGPEARRVTLERWVLPADGDTVKREVLAERVQEFPRFDERLTGQDYRYLYTVSADLNDAVSAQPLLCHDLATGSCEQHFYGDHKVSGEVVFVPRVKSGAENDGWLLSYVYDLANDTSEVVILNAGDINGEPQAVIPLPVRVPMGFHGNWIASSSM